MAASEEKTSREKSGSNDILRAEIVTRREKILFAMSLVRTACALLSGLASAIVLYKILEMVHR